MVTLPQQIKHRTPQNARLGIKSSLSNIKRVISLVYILYVANNRKGQIEYSEEYVENGATKIRLKNQYQSAVNSIFAHGEGPDVVVANPLITSQLEPLQVGLELVFQLGKIRFVASKASSAERTGGNRYAKAITFGKNIIFLDVYLSALPDDKKNEVLSAWMKNEASGTDADKALYQLLTAFTENLKMSVDNGARNVTFDQEGLYNELLSENTVVGRDAHEDVGPLRIYKSFVKEGMHPYVNLINNEFTLKGDKNKLIDYLSLVSTDLDLRNSDVPEVATDPQQTEVSIDSIQKIYYGCPGTGKSHKVKGLTEGHQGEKTIYFDENGTRVKEIESVTDKSLVTSNVFRTTFHPDYDYSNFVGSYKPVMKKVDDSADGDNTQRELEYDFVPQVFTKAYMRAYKSKNDNTLSESEKQVYIIIEEINRGNCAQIFGDLFQLLDRKDGVSEYPIIPDTELINYLNENGIPGNSIRLPENLHILATMNTSDQSLFPMDSAFKRRWAMEYVPINLENEKAMTYTFEVKGQKYSWVEFLRKVNPLIRKATDSEDKQMGEFFIKGQISENDFKNKVMFYLWNDVCKDLYSATRISQPYFMRTDAELEGTKNVFTFAELYGKGHYVEDTQQYTEPSDLLEGFISKKLGLEPLPAQKQE